MPSREEPRRAEDRARKRHELSSGMTRRVRRPSSWGTGISGRSDSRVVLGLRERERGLLGSDEVGVWEVLDGTAAGVGVSRGTIVSCSPFRLTPRLSRGMSESRDVLPRGLGGKPYLRSKEDTEDAVAISRFRSPHVDVEGMVIVDCPDGPRIRRRIFDILINVNAIESDCPSMALFIGMRTVR